MRIALHQIPMWVLHNCSLRQLRLFFDTLMKGDGSRTYSDASEVTPTGSRFFTTLKVNADRMMYLCHLLGYKVSIKQPDRWHSTYQLGINEHVNRRDTKTNPHEIDVCYGVGGADKITKVRYKGMVCCPTVANGYVIVRRNGKSCICGNCAFPAQVARMPDIRLGEWHRGFEPPEDAVLGYADCSVTVTDTFSPIFLTAIRGETQYDRHNYTPTGTWRRCLTKAQIDFVLMNHGKVEIHDGWWWVPRKWFYPRNVEYPFMEIVNSLYKHREAAIGLRKDVIKRIMTGLYGLSLQVKGNMFGPLFNPAMGAEVENNTKLYIVEWCQKNRLVPLHIAVDGVITDKQLPDVPKVPGDMHLSHKGNALIVGSGVAAMQGKWNGHDFSINYDDLMAQIKGDPTAKVYTQTKISPVTIGKFLQSPEMWDNLGGLYELHKTMDIDYEDKRFYPESPSCGGDLLTHKYDSVPWDASMLQVNGMGGVK